LKILLRSPGNKVWQKLDPFGYNNEAQLEGLLEESPDLLPTEDGKPVLFFKRQFSLSSNAVDLLGVDAAGNIIVVECKLEANREARRMVVGQILEYAAQLWGMDPEEFEGLLTTDSGFSLTELVRQRVDANTWSEESFHNAIKRALEKGEFRLVIAINGMTEELKGILEYLNARGGVRLEALELRQYTDGKNNEVLVPEMYGQLLRSNRPSGSRSERRTPEEVYANAANPEAGENLKQFVEGWGAAGHEAVPGTSGISFRVNVNGESESVLMALSPNYFGFNRDILAKRGIPTPLIEEFLKSAGSLPCADAKKFASQTEPRIRIDTMTNSDTKRLLEASLHLIKRWKDSSGQ
jgi:hypothetical protein